MVLTRSVRRLAAAALIGMAAATAASAQTFQTAAPQAILVDYETGAVLFEKGADDLVPPASMAKIMTAELVFREMAQGKLSPDTEFVVSENAWRRGGAPSGGSTMFAALKSTIKVSDLIQGLIVHSGNDAAIVLAEGIAGNEFTFARRMTERARELRMPRSEFRNASGIADPEQKTSVRELALLAAHVIRTYPDQYRVFGQREFTWNKIRQQNRNPLLTMEIGADGLKTGNVDESGYGLVGSAVIEGQRLIVAVHGLKNARDRGIEARKLLDWGFRSFETRNLFRDGETIGEARTFGGERSTVELVAKGPVRLLVPRGSGERVTARVVYTGPVRAPVAAGTEIGRLTVVRGDVRALDVPLYAREDVAVGPLTRRAWDAALELGGSWVRQGFAKVTERSR